MLQAQFIGSAVVTLATFAVAMAVMLVVNAMGLLRVSAERERYGLDLHEHGISAYPEYVITALGSPQGSSHHLSSTHLNSANAASMSHYSTQAGTVIRD